MAFSRIRFRKRRRQALRSRWDNFYIRRMAERLAKVNGITYEQQLERNRIRRKEVREYGAAHGFRWK